MNLVVPVLYTAFHPRIEYVYQKYSLALMIYGLGEVIFTYEEIN